MGITIECDAGKDRLLELLIGAKETVNSRFCNYSLENSETTANGKGEKVKNRRNLEKWRLSAPSCRVLRLVVAIVLLSAAVAKAFQLASGSALAGSALQSPFLELGLVVFEASFAVWTLFGLFPNLNRLATILLFSVFSLVTLTKGL